MLLEAAIVGWDPLADPSEVIGFLRAPLLHAVLGGAIACDSELERVLTHLRRCLLSRPGGDAVPFEFACALARQCFNTDYAFFVADDEAEPLRRLTGELEAILQSSAPASPAIERLLAVAAMYAPLHRLERWERMLGWPPAQLSDAFRPLWLEQVAHRQEELAIAGRIDALTPIRNEVSSAVRGQYEENPYPRWRTLLRPPTRARRGSILVAGCGTGKHPIHTALVHPDCEVVAVDLSRASLAYGVRMARHFGVTNLAFHQADILELGSLARRFDLIEAIGVLHHLEDPLEGWRVLTGLLQPGGAMRIALYSEIARGPLQSTRDFIRQAGFSSAPGDIRRCRRAILDLPDGDPARSVMRSDDFYSCSGFRDLVMHVREHRYTLPQIASCLRELGLEFQGFEVPPALRENFQTMFPDAAALADLASWHRFEQRQPDSFLGMYQFICGRKAGV